MEKAHLKSALAAGALAVVMPAFAGASIINETWDDYVNGEQPRSPWSLGDVRNGSTANGPDLDPDDIYVQDGWVLLDNVGNTSGNYNPLLRRSFDPTTEALNISFDYRIPENYGSASQVFFNLFDSSNRSVVLVVLGRNYLYSGITVREPTGTFIPVGHSFVANEIVHVEIANIDLATGTFDLTWSSSQGTSNTVTDLPFRDPAVIDFAAIQFGESSLETSVSKIYLDNIVVAPVPEPAAAGLALMGLAPLAVRRRRA